MKSKKIILHESYYESKWRNASDDTFCVMQLLNNKHDGGGATLSEMCLKCFNTRRGRSQCFTNRS